MSSPEIKGTSAESSFKLGQFQDGRVFLNRLEDSSKHHDEASLAELIVQKGLRKALVTSFKISWTYLYSLFSDCVSTETDSSAFEELIVIPHYEYMKHSPGLQAFTPDELWVDSSKIRLVFPSFNALLTDSWTSPRLPTIGIQHSKLILLEYECYVRVIISSQNLTLSDCSQVIFVVDASKTTSSDNQATVSRFGREIARFLGHLRPPDTTCSESFSMLSSWRNLLSSELDFSAIEDKFHVVSSVPGRHSILDDYHLDQELFGLERLRVLLRKHAKIRTNNTSSFVVDSYSSSLGSLDASFIKTISAVLVIPLENFFVIWPTMSQILGSANAKGRSSLFITSNTSLFSSEASINPADRELEPDLKTSPANFNGFGEPGGLKAKSESVASTSHFSALSNFKPLILPEHRKEHMLHAKVIVGYTTARKKGKSGSNPTDFKFMYIGSHNLSRTAWGVIHSVNEQQADEVPRSRELICASYELGVLCTDGDTCSKIPLPCNLSTENYDEYARNLVGEKQAVGKSLQSSNPSLQTS